MKRKLYQAMALKLMAIRNCESSNSTEWLDRHSDELAKLVKNYMPSGSGIDTGTTLDVDASQPDKLVFTCGYHHMNDGGMYDGWTEHTIIVTPSLAHGFSLRITGRDRNQIKEYLADTFSMALTQELSDAVTV